MLQIVYIVEWTENGVEKQEWFSIYESAVRFARTVNGVITEKDVS